MMSNRVKTVLLLGGASHQVCAIEAAKSLGCRTILCDYLPDNPGQYVADTFYQSSTTDYSTIANIALNEDVDGIITYGSDVAAPIAARVSEHMGLATNPYESVLTLSEKHRFRRFMNEQGYPCPHFVEFRERSDSVDVADAIALKNLQFPIMIKPTDSSGSKGVTTLYALTQESLEAAITAARQFSRNGILIAEERIEATYSHVIGGDIFVVAGKVHFWGLMKCLRDSELGGLVPIGKAYPSGLNEMQMEKVKDVIQNVISELNITNGPMNVEIIIGPNGDPYIVELAARAGGNLIPLQLQDISGINLVKPSVQCALGSELDDVSFDGCRKYVMSYILHSQVDGVLNEIEYSETAKAHLYREIIYRKRGEKVRSFSNAAQSIGVAFFKFSTEDEMNTFIANMKRHVSLRLCEK